MSQQKGYIYEANKTFHVRYYVLEGGKRKQRSHRLCKIDELNATKESPSVIALCDAFMLRINTSNVFNDETPFHHCPTCGNRCKRNLQQKFV